MGLVCSGHCTASTRSGESIFRREGWRRGFQMTLGGLVVYAREKPEAVMSRSTGAIKYGTKTSKESKHRNDILLSEIRPELVRSLYVLNGVCFAETLGFARRQVEFVDVDDDGGALV